jgi:hypothetical protein
VSNAGGSPVELLPSGLSTGTETLPQEMLKIEVPELILVSINFLLFALGLDELLFSSIEVFSGSTEALLAENL